MSGARALSRLGVDRRTIFNFFFSLLLVGDWTVCTAWRVVRWIKRLRCTSKYERRILTERFGRYADTNTQRKHERICYATRQTSLRARFFQHPIGKDWIERCSFRRRRCVNPISNHGHVGSTIRLNAVPQSIKTCRNLLWFIVFVYSFFYIVNVWTRQPITKLQHESAHELTNKN